MSSKTPLLLAVATVALGGAAILLESNRSASTSAEAQTALFPELKSQVGSVARIVIESSDETWTLNHDQESNQWSLLERSGYAVSPERVATLLGSLARSKRLQQKTSNPERYGDLGLDDVGAEGSNSSQVSLHLADGTTLASLIIGRSRTQGTEAHYVRLSGEVASWTASGNLHLGTDLMDWVETMVVQVPAVRLTQVDVLHPDGDTIRMQRAQKEDSNLTIMNLPQGNEASSEWVTSRFTSAMTGMNFEDVRARMDLDPTQVVKSSFHTSDGLVIHVASQLETEDPEVPGTAPTERLLINLTATFDDNPGTPWNGPLAPGVEAVETLADAPTEEAADPAVVQAEVKTLNEQFAAWTYVLPAYRRNVFLCRMDDLVKPIVVEEVADPEEPEVELDDFIEIPEEVPTPEDPVTEPPPGEPQAPDESSPGEEAPPKIPPVPDGAGTEPKSDAPKDNPQPEPPGEGSGGGQL
jgi:hypothetical protein